MQTGLRHYDTVLKYLLITVLSSLLLYYGKTLFIPMMYGLFIAIVLYPICRWLQQHHCSKTFAITLSLLLVVILFVALVWVVSLQLNEFGRELPGLKMKVEQSLVQIQEWLAGSL